MPGTIFKDALESADYRLVGSGKAKPGSPLEAYIAVRGACVLGSFEVARQLLIELGQVLPNDQSKPHLQLARLAIDAFTSKNFDRMLAELLELQDQLDGSGYIHAESHFLSGFLQNRAERFAQGLAHFRLAARIYEAIDLPALAAIAYFNICICLNHLRREEELEAAHTKLQELAMKSNSTSARLHAERFSVYRQINLYDYKSAVALARSGIGHSIELERWHDASGLLVTLSYVLIKIGREDEILELGKLARNHASKFPASDLLTYREFAMLGTLPTISAPAANRLFSEWLGKDIDGVHLMHLLDLLLDRLAKGGEWPAVERLATRSIAEAVKRQQLLHESDFAFHKLRALLMQGEEQDAQRFLLKCDRRLSSGTRFFNSIQQSEIESLMKTPAGNKIQTSSKDKQGSMLIIDLKERSAYFDDQLIQLRNHPTVFKALLILTRYVDGIAIEDFFSLMYGGSFHPLRHESRLASLIARIRKVFGSDQVVLRNEIRISIGVKYKLASNIDRRWERRSQILMDLRSAGRFATIQDIESRYRISRRMLQLDLKDLMNDGLVKFYGNTKSRKYVLTEKGMMS
jgi:hypothetical protein